jgi:hypothetical protein
MDRGGGEMSTRISIAYDDGDDFEFHIYREGMDDSINLECRARDASLNSWGRLNVNLSALHPNLIKALAKQLTKMAEKTENVV